MLELKWWILWKDCSGIWKR